MQKRFPFSLAALALLLSACSTPNTGPGGFLNHDPVTKADHETLALFYQQASQKSALKAMAQENLLEQYRKEGNSGGNASGNLGGSFLMSTSCWVLNKAIGDMNGG